jgi:ATP-dependent 26S proteasome regulatory subunit
MDKELVLYSNNEFYPSVLHYICSEENLSEKVNSICYLEESNLRAYEYRPRYRKEDQKEKKIKICSLEDTSFFFEVNGKQIYFNLETFKENDSPKLMLVAPGCSCVNEQIIFKKLSLKSDSKQTLIDFVDKAKDFCEEQIKECKKSTNKSIKVFYWRKDYWNLLFKCPKRPIETLYLKEGQKENMLGKINEFYSEETRSEYLSFGIPYKCVIMLYGIPGSGKTSTINTIASHFDCDIYTIPVSKELTDYMLIDAIASLEDKEEKKRIIVIEDIDSIFTDRKAGDSANNISLQGLLNCFDGFSCAEGTILFITANKPEILDEALLRSCRIDYRYELDYADKYQTKAIFEMVLPEQKDNFSKFYNIIKRSDKYTTAMLQEFLFFNRKCDDIIEKIEEFTEIIKKNDPKNFEKKEKTNFYM